MYRLFIIFFLVFISTRGFSQENDAKNYPIYWENGNITFLKDLGKVNLVLKNGKKINGVIIHRIIEEREIIEYQKNKTLHDLPFRDFKAAEAGDNSINIIFLNPENKLSVKPNTNFYYDSQKSNIPVSIPFSPLPEKQIVIKCDTNTIITNLNYGTSDTLIKQNETIPIRLIELTEELIRYKRRDIHDGPLYIISRKPETQIHQYNNYVKIYLHN